MGVQSRAHSNTTLELEYGTLVPMRYMNPDQRFKVVSVSGWCMWHACMKAPASARRCARRSSASDGTVAVLASGCCHRFNRTAARRS